VLWFSGVDFCLFFLRPQGPNAAPQLRPEAAAQRRLEGVSCRRLLAVVGLGRLKHPDILADADRTMPLHNVFDVALEPR